MDPEGLSRRDRSLVTLGILIALRRRGAEAHFRIASRTADDDELAEVIYHSSGYAGFPAATTAEARREALGKDHGATWGNRTPDLFITSESLYRLS